jgi:hypothetical protein
VSHSQYTALEPESYGCSALLFMVAGPSGYVSQGITRKTQFGSPKSAVSNNLSSPQAVDIKQFPEDA